MSHESDPADGQPAAWQPDRPSWKPFPLIVSWLATGVAFMVAAGILPGVSIDGFWGSLVVAAIVAVLNALIPPVLAALRLPATLVLGFLLVRSLAWLRPWRPYSYRYHEEQQLIERWLALVSDAARRDAALALEVADCARLIKGYGETHRRGKANFLAIVDALVENPATGDPAEQARAIRKAREAALADPEGRALGASLGRPVTWLKPVKS